MNRISEACALAIATACSATMAQSHMSAPPLTIDELKALYLSCDREATRARLSSAAVMQCSVIYEELKRRAFDGDFERFLAWSRSQAPEARTAGR